MQTPSRNIVLALTLFLLPLAGCKKTSSVIRQVATGEPDTTQPLQSAINPGRMDGLQYPDFHDIQPQVNALYGGREFIPMWVKNGRPTKQASSLLDEFEHAAKRGLRPQDYNAGRWSERTADLKSPESVAKFDVAMTVNAMRFLNDVHRGRTNPAHFTFGVKGWEQKKLDLPDVLNKQFADANDVAAAVDALEPQSPQFKALKQGLQHYVDLAQQDQTDALPKMDPAAKSITVTHAYPALKTLVQKLALEGDLPNGSANAATNDAAGEKADDSSMPSSSEIADGLKHFQGRHALNEDGKLGSATIDALNIPMAQRVRQIEDAMERWRWMDENYQNAAVVVNLPEFRLRAFEGTGTDHHEVFRMSVVDGKSDDDTHHTPVIADMMRYVVFRPYWNVPPSIARKEIIPHMQAQPNYLSAKGYEVVDLKGKVVEPSIAAIARGTQMVRQKSGTSNALGLVKFMFPNQFNVYLHDTNEKYLFARTRRDFSHGCVRVQDPPKLANWVLRESTKWDEDAIADAMSGDDAQDNKTVLLPKPIPVIIFYGTAWSDDGEMHFFRDMYGYDKDLEKTVDAGRPYPQKPEKAVTQKDA